MMVSQPNAAESAGLAACTPSPSHPLAPPLSIDKLQFGFELAVQSFERAVYETGRHSFSKAGMLRGSAGHYFQLQLPICETHEPKRRVGKVTLHISVRRGESGGASASGSLRLNPLRSLREVMGNDAGDLGIDGKANVVGPTDEVEGIEALSLACIARCVDEASRALEALFGSRQGWDETSSLWIQSGEATRDILIENAPHKAHRLMAANLRGHPYVERAIYDSPRTGLLTYGAATIRVYLRQTGRALKAYAKRHDLMRLEWVLDDRSAALMEGCRRRIPIRGDEAADLVSEVLQVARPEMVAFEDEVLAICRSDATPLKVVCALEPLISLATSAESSRGPRPRAAVAQAAGEAFDSLMLSGQYTLPSASREGRLRSSLDSLLRAGTLVRDARRLCYSLAPALAAAMSTAVFSPEPELAPGQ